MERTFLYTKALLGLIAFLSVVLVALLSKETLDSSLRVGIIAISLALPALITNVGIWDEVDSLQLKDKGGALFYIFGISGGIGYIAGFVALVCIFWHFSVLAALLFCVGALIWLFLLFKYFRSLNNSPNQTLNPDAQKRRAG
jgi:hypothetical protein